MLHECAALLILNILSRRGQHSCPAPMLNMLCANLPMQGCRYCGHELRHAAVMPSRAHGREWGRKDLLPQPCCFLCSLHFISVAMPLCLSYARQPVLVLCCSFFSLPFPRKVTHAHFFNTNTWSLVVRFLRKCPLTHPRHNLRSSHACLCRKLTLYLFNSGQRPWPPPTFPHAFPLPICPLQVVRVLLDAGCPATAAGGMVGGQLI